MTANLPGPYDPQDEEEIELPEVSERSRSVALILGVMGGVFGLHRFYVGRAQSAVAMVLTLGGMGIWWLYDMVTLVAGEFRDAEDLPLRNWHVGETVVGAGAASSRQVQQLTQQLEQVQRQLGELAERVDFAERLLTQQREKDRLPRGS